MKENRSGSLVTLVESYVGLFFSRYVEVFRHSFQKVHGRFLHAGCSSLVAILLSHNFFNALSSFGMFHLLNTCRNLYGSIPDSCFFMNNVIILVLTLY